MNLHKCNFINYINEQLNSIGRDIVSEIIPKSNRIIPFLYIFIPVGLSILYFFYGFYIENGVIDIQLMFFGEVYTKYFYTLSEILMDVEQFLGCFVRTIMFSLLYASSFIIYGLTDREVETYSDYHSLGKKTKIFGILSALIFFIAVLFSLLNIGLDRPEWDGQTFNLIFGNFYPEYFSYSILPFLIFAGGYAFIPYLAANYRRKHIGIQKINSIGYIYLLAFFFLFELLLIIMPFNVQEIGHADLVREFLYNSLDLFFITGFVLLFELKDRKTQLAILEQNENIEDKPQSNNSNLKEQDLSHKIPLNFYQIHTLKHLIIFFVVTGTIIGFTLIFEGNLDSQLALGKFISRVWIIGFQLCFTLFLYFGLTLIRKQRILEKEI